MDSKERKEKIQRPKTQLSLREAQTYFGQQEKAEDAGRWLRKRVEKRGKQTDATRLKEEQRKVGRTFGNQDRQCDSFFKMEA